MPKQSARRASESFGRFFARDAKERGARFASGSNVQENPLVIATVRSESLGISFIDEDSPEAMHGERSAKCDL